MTSKFSIDNRELLQRISSGEAVAGIDFGNLIVRSWLHSGCPQWTASRWR